MSEAGSRNGDPARPSRSLMRAVMTRVLVYGGTALVVALYLVDFRSLLPREASVGERSKEFLPADPGWPHLRGPHYNAHSEETALADTWPAEGPPVLWTREIGCGYSGVIAVGGRVYTQRQTLTEQTVVALDADTGRTLWEHRYGWPYEAGGMYPGPRATPTWSDGRIYFAGPDGLLGCLDADDGRPLWSLNFLMTMFWSRRADRDKRAAWAAAMVSVLLILSLLAYYDLTRRLTLPAAWYFILALPLSWPLTIPAARRIVRPRNLVADLLWMLAAFSCFFWIAAALMLWRTAHGPLVLF